MFFYFLLTIVNTYYQEWMRKIKLKKNKHLYHIPVYHNELFLRREKKVYSF